MVNIAEILDFKNKIDVIHQSESSECGLACLAMISNYHGYKVDLLTLRRKFPISIKGATLKSLIETADSLNFSSRPIRLELNNISKLKVPCILHWNMNHFVVLKKVIKNKVVILDPAIGIREFKLSEISKHFTGIALELTPTKEFEHKEEKSKLKFSSLWNSITGVRRSLLIIFTLSTLLQLFAIAGPFHMQLTVDDAIVNQDYPLLLILAIGFSLLLIMNLAIQYLRAITILYTGTQISIQIATNLFRRLIRLPLSWFEKRHIGDVVSRFSSLENVKELLTNGVIESLLDGVMVIGTLIMMFIYNDILTWIVITIAILYFTLRLAFYKTLRQLTEESIINSAKESSNFMETVRAIQTIKLFGREVQRMSLWQNNYTKSMNSNVRLEKVNIKYDVVKAALFGIENIVVLYIAGKMVINGAMSVGMLFAFMAYKIQFIERVTSLIEKIILFKMLKIHLDRIADIALTEVELEGSLSGSLKKLKGTIELRNVSFKYSENEPYIFRNLNFSVTSGQSVAIIGSSGCGKTTLLKIMLGLLPPTEGEVYVDGMKLSQFGVANYRKQVSTVMQDDQLLSGTIEENINFFSQNPEPDKVKESAILSGIHNDIESMPMGYFSLIGDMGSSLSGGQKQRVILARALYNAPRILFLDEATSHLDLEMESYVNSSIKQLNMTKITVAHRKETIQNSGKVFRLNYSNLEEVVI